MSPSERSVGRWAAALAAVVLGLSVLLASPASTRAQAAASNARVAPDLTQRGRLLVSGTLSGSWSRDRDSRFGTLGRWRLSATPSVTYFIRDRIGAGLLLGAGLSRAAGSEPRALVIQRHVSHVQVGVHGAFDIPLSQRLSLLLWPAIAYVHEWTRDELAGSPSSFPQGEITAAQRRYELGYVRCALSTPLLFRLSSRVGISFGPELWLDFIVHRQPDYGRAFQQQPPALFGDDDGPDRSQLFPAPPRRRLQVGLSAGLVVAL